MRKRTARASIRRTTARADASFSSTIRTSTSSKSTTNKGLAQARERLLRGDLVGAFAASRTYLEEKPEDAAALSLFGRLCLIAGETAAADALLTAAAQRGSNTANRVQELLEARPSFARAVAMDPDIERHDDQAVFASAVPLFPLVEAALREAVALEPAAADAHAALGNALMRAGRVDEAFAAYERAHALAPDDGAIARGLAQRALLFDRDAAARALMREALQREPVALTPSLEAESLLVAALYGSGFWGEAVALDLLVDRDATTLEKRFGPPLAPAGVAQVAFNAVCDPHDTRSLERVEAFARASGIALLNAPAAVARTARTSLPQLAHAPALIVPECVETGEGDVAVALHAFGLPALVRPRDSHRGAGLVRLTTADERARFCAAIRDSEAPGATAVRFAITRYVDYASADGFYRKYRWIVIDGVPYPHHLAISPDWMVHYFNAPMRQHAWMRDEEAQFLTGPGRTFEPRHMEALSALSAGLGLEYFGVDCAVVDDGVLVFEANANMLAHDFFGEAAFAYKTEPFGQLRAAFDRMLRSRAR